VRMPRAGQGISILAQEIQSLHG